MSQIHAPTLEPTPEIEGKRRQFYRLHMSYVDFQQAAGLASYILNNKLHERLPRDRFLLQGLNCAMIVAYCRPFSGNDRRSDLKIPDLPKRILRALDDDELELHEVVQSDRDKVMAHSDSDAWNPTPRILRVAGEDRLLPMFSNPHAPLNAEPTAMLKVMAAKLMEECFTERLKFEPELSPYLPIEEHSLEDIQQAAKELGIEISKR